MGKGGRAEEAKQGKIKEKSTEKEYCKWKRG
jgi:hypothetical protein